MTRPSPQTRNGRHVASECLCMDALLLVLHEIHLYAEFAGSAADILDTL
jgi:hypothetical protein